MSRPRNPPDKIPVSLRDLLIERSRVAEAARTRQERNTVNEDLPSLIDERVGEQMADLETRLVDGFRDMGNRVAKQSMEALTAQLNGRITQLEQISAQQTETIDNLRDSSRISGQKVSTVVYSIEKTLGDAVPGFRLPPPSHLPSRIDPQPDRRELVKSPNRSLDDVRIPSVYCPKCTSVNVRRSSRTGMWEEFLRLFFIAPFRCRSCRHKFYQF